MLGAGPCKTSALLLLALVGCVASVGAQARLEVRDGRVYLSARGVPLHDLLRLWEMQTGTKIVLADGLPNEPVTIEFQGEPEREVLDSLLKSAVGYVAMDRAIADPDRSRYALVLVLSRSDVRNGPLDRVVREMSAPQVPGERIADYRDLPPRSPGDPNGPIGLTPASPGRTEPPPLAFPEDDAAAMVGSDPGVNPIPASQVPPPNGLEPVIPVVDVAGAAVRPAPGAPAKPAPSTKLPKPPGR